MLTADLLVQHYPSLAGVPADRLARDLAGVGVIATANGSILFREGETCGGFPFIIEGQVQVARSTADGRGLELYRVSPGQICVVSAGCLFGNAPMSARGVAVGTTRLLMVDRNTLFGWTEFPAMREYLFGLMADRMAELMALVEAVAFQRLDRRLARALLGRGPVIHLTHQQLADELGTAREMVSRLLRRFEADGLVRLGREQIDVLGAAELREIAEPR